MPTERGRLRPTPVGGGLLVLAPLLYLAGSNVGSGWVVLIAALVTGGVGADLVAVTRRRATTGVEACVRTDAGEHRVEVRTRSGSTPGSTRVEVPIAGGRLLSRGAGPAAAAWPLRLGPGRLDRIDVLATTVGPLHLAANRWRGSMEVSVVVPVQVLPAATRLAVVSGAAGTTGVRPRGREVIRGLREHAPGDEARSVHWRATARHGRLLVRDAGRAGGPEVRVVIEDGTWTPPAMALATTVAASLGAAGAAAGRAVTIEVAGTSRAWSADAPFTLATTPPLRGGTAASRTGVASDRPRSAPAGAVAVRLTAAGSGVLATDTDGATLLADEEGVSRWLGS